MKSKESKKLGRPKAKKTRLVISDEVYRKLSRISEESRMPIQLVYEDALLNGVSTLVGDEGMYSSAINYRKNREQLISANESDKRVVQERKPQRSERAEFVEPDEAAYSAEFEPKATDNGSDLLDEQPGYRAEDESGLEPAPGYTSD